MSLLRLACAKQDKAELKSVFEDMLEGDKSETSAAQPEVVSKTRRGPHKRLP